MANLTAAEMDEVGRYLAQKKGKHIVTVNGRPFDLSKVRAPMVSEDVKHTMYANPRLMLKEQKPTYAEDPANGVEYEWLLKGSYDRLSRRDDYRPVLMQEVDFTSKVCKLGPASEVFSNKGEKLSIVSSGEFELYETRGESAYLLKRYGADVALNNLKNEEASGTKAFRNDAIGTGLQSIQTNSARQTSLNWDGEQPGYGSLGDPSTWGGRGGKFV